MRHSKRWTASGKPTGGRERRSMPILKYVKAVRSKGRSYHYFNTGKSDNGKLIYVKLPPFGTPQFATSYATLLGHRNRVPEVVEAEELSLSDLIKQIGRAHV